MNKILKVAAIASVGLILTGCGEKKITCSHTASDSYVGKSSEKITYHFDKEGIMANKVVITNSTKYTDKYLEYRDDKYDETMKDMYEEAMEDCEDYEDTDFITCTTKLKGNSITQTITYNLKNLDEESVKDLYKDKDLDYSTYADIVEYLSQDYNSIKKDAAKPESKYSCK